MIDDFYKILNLRIDASFYKIALHYKLLSKKILLTNDSKLTNDIFYKINNAFEVLRNEQVRKYYDILYKVLIKKTISNISDERIEQYLEIVNNYSDKGKKEADNILNNEEYILTILIKRPLFISFIIGTFILYCRYRLIGSPLAGILFLITGTIITLKDLLGITSDLWAIGLITFIIGLISIAVNFRNFTIDLMNKQKNTYKITLF